MLEIVLNVTQIALSIVTIILLIKIKKQDREE